MKKKKNTASNSEEKPPKDEGYPFKKVNEDMYKSNVFVESEWYELRSIDSLRYHYPEDEVQ